MAHNLPRVGTEHAGRVRQVSVTSFSQTGVARRGDGRDWTETPAQKLMRLTAAATAEPAALPPSAAEAGADSAKAAATAATVDAYNAGARRKTLVEQHQDRLAAEQKVRLSDLTIVWMDIKPGSRTPKVSLLGGQVHATNILAGLSLCS